MATAAELRERVHGLTAIVASGTQMPAGKIQWISGEVGIIFDCGAPVALILPLGDRAKLDKDYDNPVGDGAVQRGGSTGGSQFPVPDVVPFDATFSDSFDGVLAAVYPELLAPYALACVRARA
jgi:hypothetical protein